MAHVANNTGMASGMTKMGAGMMGPGTDMMKMSPGMMKDMMGSGMMNMSPGMMKDMMGSGMMTMGQDMMKGMMGSGMGREAVRGSTNIVVVAAPRVGQSVLGRLFRHPVVLLGIGITAGILIYKYRQQINAESED